MIAMSSALRSKVMPHALYCALISMGLGRFILDATLIPGRLAVDHWVIADDARQFQAWMARLADANAMKGNLIADYWQSTSPWLYRQPYYLFASLGVSPRVTGLILTCGLILVTAWLCWKVASSFEVRPFGRLLIASGAMAAFMQDTAIFSATPRSYAPALTMLLFWGLLKRSRARSFGALFLAALLYPAVAITGLGMFCLDQFWRYAVKQEGAIAGRLMAMGFAVLLVLGPLIIFRGEISQWGPVVKLSEIGDYPAMSMPRARNAIVQADGSIGWFCSGRMGFLHDFVKCRQHLIDLGGILDAILYLPLLFFIFLFVRNWKVESPNKLYALSFLSALLCWSCASIVAFRLHLPGRYSHHVLAPLAIMAIAQFYLLLRDASWVPSRWNKLHVPLIAIVLALAFLFPHMTLTRPNDRQLLTRIQALQKGAVIGGIDDDLDFVPALTGVAVTATVEHSVPYTLGYFRPYSRELEGGVKALMSSDARTLLSYLEHRRLAAIVMSKSALASGDLPKNYRRAVPGLILTGTRPLLAQAPSHCRSYTGPVADMFDVPCLIRWLK